jgi:hypothetical protein
MLTGCDRLLFMKQLDMDRSIAFAFLLNPMRMSTQKMFDFIESVSERERERGRGRRRESIEFDF